MDRLRCKNTPCGNLVLAECPNSQCHMHCEGCPKHSLEPVKQSRTKDPTKATCVDGAVNFWTHNNTCNALVHPHCAFNKCAAHCTAYFTKSGACFHPDIYESIEAFNKIKEAEKEKQLKDTLLLCTFGDNCDCQAPKGCKNAMCSDHCLGCDLHKVAKKKESKPTSKAAPLEIPDIHCIAYDDCKHIVNRECMFIMCTDHCPGCPVHKKDYEEENKPIIRKQQELLSNSKIDESLHRAVKAQNISLVQDLISKGKNMYALDIHENSSVYYACLVGSCGILTMFLDQGYQLDLGSFEGQRCWLSAADERIRDILRKRCLDSTTKMKLWFEHCYRGKVDAIKKLQKEGFDVNTRDANGYSGLDLSSFVGNVEVAKYLTPLVFSSIHLDMKKLVNSQNYADMEINVKGQIVYAHKALVILRLPTWKSIFEVESEIKYKVTEAFEYLTAETLVQLLEYLYTGTAFFPNMDALGIVATSLQLEYLHQWCCRYKIKQYKTVLPPDPSYLQDMRKLFDSKFQSDITFNVQDKIVCAHKFILGTRSEYFNSMFSSKMKEASQDIVNMDTSYEAFVKALEFLYINTLTLNNVTVENITEIIELSVKWLVKKLNNFCDRLLCSDYSIDSENVADLLQFSQLYNVHNLHQKCLNYNKKI